MDVYLGDRLVGHLSRCPAVRHNEVKIQTVYHPSPILPTSGGVWSDPIPMPTIQMIIIPVRQRQAFISDADVARIATPDKIRDLYQRRAELGIPEDAEAFADFNRRGTTFRWNVLSVDSDLLESLFDVDDFEPADTEPDFESFRNTPAGLLLSH